MGLQSQQDSYILSWQLQYKTDTCTVVGCCRLCALQKEEGMEIVSAAICAGIFNDLGSGSNVDLCILTKASSTLNFTGSYFYESELGLRS